MARSKDTCGVAIAAAVKAVSVQAGTAISDAQLEAVWKAAMGALFTHDTANAVVTVDVLGTVNSGPGAGGGVTGTGTKVGAIT